MFKSKVVFVLGAGSSKEVGLPLGNELKNKISELIRHTGEIRDPFALKDIHISQALAKHCSSINLDSREYVKAAERLRNALRHAKSIDNLLEAHSGDELLSLCGKLSIVQAIIKSELGSELSHRKTQELLKIEALEKTWFFKIFQMIIEGLHLNHLETAFKSISFINFNYDRCLEHYLFHALMEHYAIEREESAQLVTKLTVLRPYGKIGDLPWQNPQQSSSTLEFGASEVKCLQTASSRIRTFNEQIFDKEVLQAIREEIQEARILVFLGFGFHEQNLKLLESAGTHNIKRIYATTMNISPYNRDWIENQLYNLFSGQKKRPKIESQNSTCFELLEYYERGIVN